MSIQQLWRKRARERATPLRWNIDSVILGYSTLAAVIIMSLKDVDFLITVLIAVLGLGSVWLSGWIKNGYTKLSRSVDETAVPRKVD